MQAATRVAKNTGILYARMAITVFISLYVTRLILAALGADDFGIFNVVGGAIVMLTFLNGAMAGATQRFMSYAQGEGNSEKLKSIFNVSVVLHLIVGFTVVFLLEGVGYFLFDGVLKIDPDRLFAAKMIYHFMVVSTFFTIISVPYDAVINAHENMMLVAIMGIFEALLKLGVALYVTYTASDKLIYYGLLMACISILLMIVQRIYCHLKYDEVVISPKKYYDKIIFVGMTRFAGWSLLNTSSGIIGQYGLGIVLNYFWGTLLNAANGIAAQLNGQLLAFSNTMLKALNPVIVKSEGSGNRELMLNASLAGSKFAFLLLAIFAIPFLLETPYILKIWLKNVPDWTILFCRLQLIRSLTEQLTISIGSSINAQGDISGYSKIRSILNLLPIVLTGILFYFGFPPYTLYILWIFCWSILGGYLVLFFANKNCGLSYKIYFMEVLKPSMLFFIVVSLFGLIPHITMNEGLNRLVVVVFLSIILFIPASWIICFNRKEKNLIIQIFHKIRVMLK